MLGEARSHQLPEQLASAQGLQQRGKLLRAERGVVHLLSPSAQSGQWPELYHECIQYQ